MNWVLGAVTVVVAIPLLLHYLPPISIPGQIYNVLSGSFFVNLLQSIAYFVPVGFLFTCLFFIISVRVSILLWHLIMKVLDLIRG